MDQATFDRLEMYIKWSEDLDLDYDKHFGHVDDPDHLVQISRDGLQKQLDSDPSVFTEEDLNKLKEKDHFILANIENSSRWLSSDNKEPKSHWWWHLDKIKSGEMEKPDIEKIFILYFNQLK